jgi:hypothetical protein
MARRNTFEAVAKELAEDDAPTALQKKQWLLDFANKEFGKRPVPATEPVRQIQKSTTPPNRNMIGWRRWHVEVGH